MSPASSPTPFISAQQQLSIRGQPRAAVLAASLALLTTLLPHPVAGQYLDETREATWSESNEPDLLDKATELATAPAIYEFVRNEFEFLAYDGARSNAINTFLHRKGNDIDIASVLIAMLRSQGVPARYAVGIADFHQDHVTSWLQIPNAVRAEHYLRQTGTPASATASRIQLFRTWVQALVPTDAYRGSAQLIEIDCAAEPSRCSWVDLDPSFKLHRFRDPSDLVDVSAVVEFDYTAYYNGANEAYTSPDGLDRAEKNPLEVYEEQILQYLQSTPGLEGKTLEDVIYQGRIEQETHGVLPTSLPFRTDPATVRTYASVEDHDAAPGEIPWTKTVTFTISFPTYAPFANLTISSGAPIPLVDLSTRELTFAYESTDFDSPTVPKQLVARLGGQVHEVMLTHDNDSYTSNGGSGSISSTPPGPGTQMEVRLATQSVLLSPFESTHSDVTLGGSYLVATGGQQSSWSQVHRSARRLLSAIAENPVILDEDDNVLYVDANGDGSTDGDVPLLEDHETQALLTGGVLSVAKALHYARHRDTIERAARLQRSTMPPAGFLGLVSSVHAVTAIDGTAFEVMPAGLLIDNRTAVIDPFRIDADLPNDDLFRLVGHAASAHEHEVWQELTGFEAVSTMKGIQRTLADGGALLFLDEAETQVSLADALTAWGYEPHRPYTPLAEFDVASNWTDEVTTFENDSISLDGSSVKATGPAGGGSSATGTVQLDALDLTGQSLRFSNRWEEQTPKAGVSPSTLLVTVYDNQSPTPQSATASLPVQSSASWAAHAIDDDEFLASNPLIDLSRVTQVSFQVQGNGATTGWHFWTDRVAIQGAAGVFPEGITNGGTRTFLGHQLQILRAPSSPGEVVISVIRQVVDGGTPPTRRKAWEYEAGIWGSVFDHLFAFFDELELKASRNPDSLQFASPYNASHAIGLPDSGCVTATTVGQLEANLPSCFASLMDRPELGAYREYLDYFDMSNGFALQDHLYRAFDPAVHIPSGSLARIRDELALGADLDGDGVPDPPADIDGDGQDDPPPAVEYVVPSIVSDGELQDFAVWIGRYIHNTDGEVLSRYTINRAVDFALGVPPPPNVPFPLVRVTSTRNDYGVSVGQSGGSGAHYLIDRDIDTWNTMAGNDQHSVTFAAPQESPITGQRLRVYFVGGATHAYADLLANDNTLIHRFTVGVDPSGWHEFDVPMGYETENVWHLKSYPDFGISFAELERELTYEEIQELP